MTLARILFFIAISANLLGAYYNLMGFRRWRQQWQELEEQKAGVRRVVDDFTRRLMSGEIYAVVDGKVGTIAVEPMGEDGLRIRITEAVQH